MNNFINILSIAIILICILTYYESKTNELIMTLSTIDKKKYLVRNQKDRLDSANTLAKININILKLIDILYSENKNNKHKQKVLRLKNKYNSRNIRESEADTNYTSYSVNKGEKLVFCIRNKITDQIISINTIMFVAIHELAHLMSISVGHTEEFWENMRFILKTAIKHNIYKKQYFNKSPVKYCGIMITNSPLDN